MTDTKKNYEPNYPSHNVFHVPEGKNAFWTKIGAAWEHKDGDGYNIELDLVPLRQGRIVLRKYEPQTNEEENKKEKAAK